MTMSRLRTRLIHAAIAAVAAIAVMGIGASAASAATAGFNITPGVNTPVKFNGTVSLGGAVTCTFTNQQATAVSSATQGIISVPGNGFYGSCNNGGQLGFTVYLEGQKNGSAFSVRSIVSELPSASPFGIGKYWYVNKYEVPWTNGAGATPSKITYNKTLVSTSAGDTIILTGSLNVTKADGSLLKLQ